MAFGTILAIYFIVWWLCLFMVLPFRVHNQIDAGEIAPGTEPGAPVLLRAWQRLIATTLLAAVLTGLIFLALENPMLREYWR